MPDKRSLILRASRILDHVIFYGLLAAIVLTAIPYGTVQPWWIAAFECIVFILGVFAVIDLVLTKSALPEGKSLAAPLMALCLFILFQSLPIFSPSISALADVRLAVSADPYASLQLAIKIFAFMVAGMLLLRHVSNEKRLRLLVYVVIGIGVASAAFGLLRQGMPTSTAWLLPLPNPIKGFAQFVNRNHFAFLIEMALGLTMGLVAGHVRSYRKLIVLLPMAAFLWAVLIFSNSRGGIFASLCQLLFLFLLLDPLKRLRGEMLGGWSRVQHAAGGLAMKLILIGLLVGVFAYGVSWVGGESVVSNFEISGYSFSQQGGQYARENVSRKDIWSATWELIKAKPIAGAGFGAYWIAITKYHKASGTFTPQEAHNDYLELLASGGIIGCAIVLWFSLSYVKKVREVLQNSRPFVTASTLGAVTGIFGVIIHSFVDFGLHVTINALVFSVLIVIPLAGYRMSRDHADSGRSLVLS